ncbi:MAG: hydantoinase/oxoprolinase family protein [Gaiellaceae bacterium]
MRASSQVPDVRIGVDVGGTFTDLVALVDGELCVAKVPSTTADQSEGVMTAIASTGVDVARVDAIAHGTTVATNALLERRGARTALVTTDGFRDVIEIGRQTRASLYDLTRRPPEPLVPRELRFTIRERVDPTGEAAPLDEASVRAAVEELRRAEVESVAVCFLFSFLDPAHERRAGELLRSSLPGVRISLSSDVLPEFREYERFSTTAADAYLAPRLDGYLERLAKRLRGAGLPAPLVMQSSGGVVDLEQSEARASACVLSGPAAGVVGAAYAAAASGFHDLLTFDMGGTSTDVALVVDGEAQTTTTSIVAGVPIRHAMVDVHTVSAGGGSIAWADSGGALRVGPRSAGARPGPAAYGLGGRDATVTDAELHLGYLADGARLGGEIALQQTLAAAALAAVGAPLGLTPLETALGVITIAEAEMGRALRVISVERGFDPRDFTLVAFGGAGGMHACRLAEELEISTVLVPRAGGVLSALGLAISDLRRDYVAALVGDFDTLAVAEINAAFEALEQQARVEQRGSALRRFADLRYRGQSFELTVAADDVDDLPARFADAHRRRYGFEMHDAGVQIVSVRVTATVRLSRPSLATPQQSETGSRSTRSAHFDGAWYDVDVRTPDNLGAGVVFDGPAIVEFREATCVVRPGWGARVDDVGALVLERA